MSEHTENFDLICGNCAGINMDELTAGDVIDQAAVGGLDVGDERVQSAILGLREYQSHE